MGSRSSSPVNGWGGGSRGSDLHDVVIGGGQDQHLLGLAVVEHLARAEGLQAGHGQAPLLLLCSAAQ